MKKKFSNTVPDAMIPVVNSIPKPDVPALLTALPGADIRDLKQQWRSLFGSEVPPYNRRFLESRLGSRQLNFAKFLFLELSDFFIADSAETD